MWLRHYTHTNSGSAFIAYNLRSVKLGVPCTIISLYRGRILGRNADKSLLIHSHLQLCLEIYISSNSRNLSQFLERRKE
jgi:hypothetical protein